MRNLGNNQTLRRLASIAVVAGTVGLAEASPAAALTVQQAHPRIIFDADTLPQVRARLLGAHAAIYADFKDDVDGRLEDNKMNSFDADDYAAMYVLSQQTQYADAAISVALDMVAAGQDVSGEGDGPARSSVISLVYDWCYDRLTSGQRTTIYNALYPNVDNLPTYRQEWFIRDYNWSYMIAIANDGNSSQDAAVISALEASIDQLDNFNLPCLNVSSPASAIDGYSGIRIMTLICLVDALENATDYNGNAFQSAYHQNTGKFWLARYRPDYRWARVPGKYNTSESSDFGYFSYCGSRIGDPDAQGLVNALIADGDIGKRDATLALAWHDPTAPATPMGSLPKEYYDPVAGFCMFRSGWTLGSGSNDITVAFFNGSDQVRHRTQNHFYVTRGADNLLIDSGHRFHDLANHYNTYYKKTIAHNSLLIFDPSESFGSFTNVWGDEIEEPNDGGQRSSDSDEGELRWPECDGLYGYRGEIVEYEANSDFVNIVGDASPVYSSSKAQTVMRRWVYLRPDWIVVQDRVVLNKPNLPVRAVYHTVDRPEVDQSLEVVEGNLSLGGVFRSADARRVVINRGSSSARIYWVQADGGPAELRLIGGPNASGQYWKQTYQPEDSGTYGSTQSYEFYVDGKNYPPGYFVDEDDIANRNSDPATTPGDWRVELQVTGSDEVVLTALIHVTSIGAPLAEITSEPLAEGGVSFAVRQAGEEFHLSLCPPGTDCDGVGYTH